MGRRYVTENPMACDEVTWRSRDGSWGSTYKEIWIHGIQGSLGVQYSTKGYIEGTLFLIDKDFMLNSNSILIYYKGACFTVFIFWCFS